MYQHIFQEFTASDDTLRVYESDRLVFASRKDRLLPLMEYIDRFSTAHKEVVIFDKITGNAAALLSIKAGGREVFSMMGSELAIQTLAEYGVACHFTKTVPTIQRADGEDMCPMEKLSLDKTPDEFHQAMVAIIGKSTAMASD